MEKPATSSQSSEKRKTSSPPSPRTKKQRGSGNTRASRACSACRKQKTRCFTSPNHPGCLRCVSLGAACSFDTEMPDDEERVSVTRDTLFSANSVSSGYSNMRALPLTLSSSRARSTSDSRAHSPSVSAVAAGLGSASDTTTILKGIQEILAILRPREPSVPPQPLPDRPKHRSSMLEILNSHNYSYPGVTTPISSAVQPEVILPHFDTPSEAFLISPFNSIGTISSPNHLPLPLQQLLQPKIDLSYQDIITLGIITQDQAIQLLQIFRDRYGRWVSFPDKIPTALLVDKFRFNSSILLTTCCCLALRYSDPFFKNQVYHLLLHKLQVDLNNALTQLPQPLEFMQALVILSIYGLSLSSETFVIDAWFLSGIALQHFVTNDTLGTLLSESTLHGPRDPLYAVDRAFTELTVYRVWNHLSLVHLVNCNFSGRACIIDEARLTGLMTSLSAFKNVNNFDGRMVAEISLQYIIYCFIKRMEEAQDRENLPETHDQAQENSRGNSPAQNLPLSPLAHTKEELRTWQERWKKLLEQPASQFVVLGYHYGYLMVLYNWNFMKLSTAARTRASKPLATTLAHTDSTTLRSMLYHARKVVREILSVANDSYFAFLSDQIHFCTLFSAIMLINILRLVGSARTGDIDSISLSSGELAGYLSEISDLAKRFRRVATGESDVVMKYALTIEEEMRGVFPEEQIRGAYPVARK